MFYLFIFESIGTSELFLLGLVALIIFGPRKLPEMVKMAAKAMGEFRRSTDEFKRTWQQEVEFEDEATNNQPKISSLSATSNVADSSVQRDSASTQSEIIEPQIKELAQSDFEKNFSKEESQTPKISESDLTNKKDWL